MNSSVNQGKKITEQKSINIGLLWHSLSSGNLGVCALSESNISIIRKEAEKRGVCVRFLVLGGVDGGGEEIRNELLAGKHDIECHRVRVFRHSFRELVRQCDFLIDIGEGDSFSDIYGFKRFFFYWLSKNIVCSLGKPLILAPQTIGPFRWGVTRILARQVLSKCKNIFSRDRLSKDYLNSISFNRCIQESVDVAFRLPFDEKKTDINGYINVGINVSGLLLSGGYTRRNQFGLSIDYGRVMHDLIGFFYAQERIKVHLIGHVIEPEMSIEDDISACKKISGFFPDVIIAPAFTRPSEAKAYIAEMDFFVGARMHACIAAFSAGVPVVPMAYSRKFNGLFGSLGYNKVVDCKVDDHATVVASVIDSFLHRDKLKMEIQECLKGVDTQIGYYENYIGSLIDFLKHQGDL